MAQFTITIPPAQVTRVVTALAASYGVEPTANDVKTALLEDLKARVRLWEDRAAASAASDDFDDNYTPPGMTAEAG